MNPYVWSGAEVTRERIGSNSDSKNIELEAEVRALRGQVDRLTLACQAMWELLRDSNFSTEEDLERKITEVDLRDGSKDGRLGSTVLTCRSCNRKTNSRRSACVWCGEEVDREHIFEG